MTKQEHAKYLADKFKEVAVPKYYAGAKEHGGNLWEVPTLKLMYEARSEVIDQFVYIQTAIDQMEALSLLKEEVI